MSEVISSPAGETPVAQPQTSHLRLALLTNMVPPFRRPLFIEIGRRCRQLRVFISTPMEVNRNWRVDWNGLDVQVQKTATLTRRVGHNSSADERQFIHFPIDTIPALLRFKADAVLSSELGFRTICAIVNRWLNPKSRLLTWVCVSEFTETQRGKGFHKLRKLLCKSIDGFLVNGDSGARYLKSLGVTENRIFRAPYPTDMSFFTGSEVSRSDDAMYRMLSVGQLVTRKGLLPFLRVLAGWARTHPSRRIEFILVGSGPLESALRETSLPSNVIFSIRPPVAYAEVAAVYREAGIFVFPTLADEWGTVATEAMACGLPVLGSLGSQAVEELIQEGVNGWVFHPEREEQIFSAIDRCMSTPADQLNQMRVAAKQSSLRLSPEAIAGQVLEAVRVCLYK